jgi:hypothetical protein
VDTPICSACAQPQRGIVEFRWSDGAVVYECVHCGAFNEVSEVRRRVVTRVSRGFVDYGARRPLTFRRSSFPPERAP